MLELNISCPNVEEGGLSFGTDPHVVERVVKAVRNYVKQPLIVKLSPEVTDITEIARAAVSGGADALSLINTLRGMKIDIHKRKPILANKIGGLVIGTGDMSELALGWATYNGDHMSMYGVNCSVPKMLVRHLVRYYADTCGEKELSDILLDVLDTPVSPELLPPEEDGKIAQKTEDLVGPYELHDFYLYYILRFGYRPGKIYRLARQAFDGAYDKETILKWLKVFYRRFFNQQFKRSCLPDGPKVGSAAVSPRGDLRMPSDACSRLWLEELETLDEDCVYGVPETKAAGGSL